MTEKKKKNLKKTDWDVAYFTHLPNQSFYSCDLLQTKCQNSRKELLLCVDYDVKDLPQNFTNILNFYVFNGKIMYVGLY